MKNFLVITPLLWLILSVGQCALAAPCPVGQNLIALPNPGTWTATASSVHLTSGPDNTIDNRTNTAWHAAAPTAWPQNLTVDMGSVMNIGGIQVFPFPYDLGMVNGYQIWTSTDGSTYTLQTTGNLPIPTANNYEAFFIEFPAEVSARYYRFVATSGHADYVVVSEVNPMVCAASDPAPTTPVFAPGTCPQYELNTGYNKTADTKVDPNLKQYDERWLVTRIPQYTTDTAAALANVNNWQRAVVSGDVTGNVAGSGSGNWYDSPYGNAEWITQSIDGKNETTANVDNPADDVDYLFRLDFNINVTDPNLVGILSPLNLGLFADNTVWDVLVNGTSLRVAGDPNLPTSGANTSRDNVYTYLGYVEGNHFDLNVPSSLLVPGDNSIVVHLKSGNPFLGFLMQTYSDPTCGAVDYGDLPDTYSTLDASSGPYHVTSETLRLGAANTEVDSDGQPSVDAAADDTNGTDDDDGVTFYSVSGGGVYADAQVVNDTGADAYVCAWLDRWTDGGGGTAALDDTFDPGDIATSPAQVCQAVADNSGGTTTVTFSWSGLPAVSGDTYLRFRVCSTQSECEDPVGFAANGEVEDYRVAFDFAPTAVTLGGFEMEAQAVQDYLNELGVDRLGRAELLALIQALAPNRPVSESDDNASLIAHLRASLDPDNDGQVAVLRWDTLEERGTIGFYVHRREEAKSDWIQVNDDMLPGLITAPMGGRYMLADPEARSGGVYQYHLIEQEAAGTTRSYGPFTLKMP
ncbi:F5/8 type C domain-containing protein [Candidatus Electrothrix marina]|uniref:F5/8 type C domain-containing protein n=1 Tax=Candidatus Electrothrix marina TaxID=1859130 RepID=A0A444JHA8_9BACT|nr:F5/8 type C domain-containing protein [Candidatus Electrothrix marina]